MPSFGMLESLNTSLDAYPHWLVVTCAAIVAVVILWVLLKVLKVALRMVFFGIVVMAAIWAVSFIYHYLAH